MFKFNINRKAAKEAAEKKVALRADLEKLLKMAEEPFTVKTAIEHRKRLYCEVQKIRKTYGLSNLPKCISRQNGWISDVKDIPYTFHNDEGLWENPTEDWMKKWEDKPTEIGPIVTEKVTPIGSWIYYHQAWCHLLKNEIKLYLATT